MAESGRVLGLDLGDVRIGVAISDAERRLALPFGTVHTGAPEDVKSVAKIVRENDISEIVVGLPLTMSGERREAAVKAETFAGVLREVLELPVALQDERLSTVEAGRVLAAGGKKGRKHRELVDRSAATVILQSYLDSG